MTQNFKQEECVLLTSLGVNVAHIQFDIVDTHGQIKRVGEFASFKLSNNNKKYKLSEFRINA